MRRPDPSEHSAYHANYISRVVGDDPIAALRSGLESTRTLLAGLPDDVAMTRHPPYTWSIKEVIGHLIDAERIFGYRALRFARGDTTPLPSFEENSYAVEANSDACSIDHLADEFADLRRSHIAFFEGLPDAAWDRRGVASDVEVSVRALAFIMAGHEEHHASILRKRLGRS
jgi:hypothetical protein